MLKMLFYSLGQSTFKVQFKRNLTTQKAQLLNLNESSAVRC